MSEDWVEELRGSEPSNEVDASTPEIKEAMTDKYDTVDEVWKDVYWEKDYNDLSDIDDTGFRLPIREGDRPSCLGKTLALAMYAEFDGGHNVDIKVQYDDVFDHEDGSRALSDIPHVATNVDGKDYGLKEYENMDVLPVEAVKDLYRIGIGTEVLDGEEQDVIEDDENDLGYDTLVEWGSQIKETYSDAEQPSSSYMARQGALMEEEARVENEKEESGIDFFA